MGLAVDPDSRQASVVDEREHTDDLGGTVAGLASFARDLTGELYVVAYGGEIFRLAADEPEPVADGGVPRRPLY